MDNFFHREVPRNFVLTIFIEVYFTQTVRTQSMYTIKDKNLLFNRHRKMIIFNARDLKFNYLVILFSRQSLPNFFER